MRTQEILASVAIIFYIVSWSLLCILSATRKGKTDQTSLHLPSSSFLHLGSLAHPIYAYTNSKIYLSAALAAKILDSSTIPASEPSTSFCRALRLTTFDFVFLCNVFCPWKDVFFTFDFLVLGVVASLAGSQLMLGWTVTFQSPLPRHKCSLVS